MKENKTVQGAIYDFKQSNTSQLPSGFGGNFQDSGFPTVSPPMAAGENLSSTVTNNQNNQNALIAALLGNGTINETPLLDTNAHQTLDIRANVRFTIFTGQTYDLDNWQNGSTREVIRTSDATAAVAVIYAEENQDSYSANAAFTGTVGDASGSGGWTSGSGLQYSFVYSWLKTYNGTDYGVYLTLSWSTTENSPMTEVG